MKQAQELHQLGVLSEADRKRIMAENYEYGIGATPNRRQRKAREAALRRAD